MGMVSSRLPELGFGVDIAMGAANGKRPGFDVGKLLGELAAAGSVLAFDFCKTEGPADGRSLCVNVGRLLDATVVVGDELGFGVGDVAGAADGKWLGFDVGKPLGELDSDALGVNVGCEEGCSVQQS